MSDVDEEDDDTDNFEYSSDDRNDDTIHHTVKDSVDVLVDDLVAADIPGLAIWIVQTFDLLKMLVQNLVRGSIPSISILSNITSPYDMPLPSIFPDDLTFIQMYSTLLSSLSTPFVVGHITTRQHGGARAGVGAGFSQPISAHDEPIELLRRDIKEMQTNLLWIIRDNT
ncbi:hypothetical protein Syun_025381 [Stephania yunnanensis]|uniref:Uncharacterized protein n=1 Tax=Stephania yunnanensis TaxID=152371 RepID=A0AAP0ES37_9MAGN